MEDLSSTSKIPSESSTSNPNPTVEPYQINSNSQTVGDSNKFFVKKVLLKVLLVIAIIAVATSFLFNKFVHPIVTLVPDPLKPWSKTEGKICDFGGCRTSEVNQIYYYWLSEALDKKNANLCNNTQGLDGGDTGISPKEYSINECKIEYSKKTGDLKVCESLSAESRVRCIFGVAENFSKLELLNIEICNDLKDYGKIGNCLASISLKTNTYTCNQSSSKEIQKSCNDELFKFHEDALNGLKGTDVIKEKKTVTIPLISNIWGGTTQTLGLNPDGSISLWLNGTRHSCKPGTEVFLRSDGANCSSIPIYYITRCSLEGDKVTLEYFTYNVDCRW